MAGMNVSVSVAECPSTTPAHLTAIVMYSPKALLVEHCTNYATVVGFENVCSFNLCVTLDETVKKKHFYPFHVVLMIMHNPCLQAIKYGTFCIVSPFPVI
ncbi:hypothetical protein COCON_G00022860 [Conger conger]|uniref:Uncharacterized protein n=1 Tax=Conger conger TaxID=82655 RepID=A0A9Q1DX48_CONCO|nr:hypothetical protein COCON_G00022860 [Conger conger]